MISVIILTYNEEKNIERCLKSIVDLTDDIIIIDSYSNDLTLDICKRYKCKIYQNPFINQALQFNWGLDNINLKYEWVLRLDSDEILPFKLKNEIRERVGNEPEFNGYYLNRRMYWMNKWLKHGRMYPHYILRLIKKDCGRYENREEEHIILKGDAGYLKNDFLEDNRINTLPFFINKHLRTGESEVREIIKSDNIDDGISPSLFGNKVNRTRWFKIYVYANIPLFIRPFLYFIYRYVFCAGFLDGKEGLIFHVLQGFWYRFYIDSRVFEEQSEWTVIEKDYSNI